MNTGDTNKQSTATTPGAASPLSSPSPSPLPLDPQPPTPASAVSVAALKKKTYVIKTKSGGVAPAGGGAAPAGLGGLACYSYAPQVSQMQQQQQQPAHLPRGQQTLPPVPPAGRAGKHAQVSVARRIAPGQTLEPLKRGDGDEDEEDVYLPVTAYSKLVCAPESVLMPLSLKTRPRPADMSAQELKDKEYLILGDVRDFLETHEAERTTSSALAPAPERDHRSPRNNAAEGTVAPSGCPSPDFLPSICQLRDIKFSQHTQNGAPGTATPKPSPLGSSVGSAPGSPSATSSSRRRLSGSRSDDLESAIAQLPVYEQFQLNKQARALEKWRSQQLEWKKQEARTSCALSRQPEESLMCTAEEHAMIQREYEVISKAHTLASAKGLTPLFEEPVPVSKGNVLTLPMKAAPSLPVEKVGKPGNFAPQSESEFYLQRKEDLHEQLEQLEPFTPDFSGLEVVGRRLDLRALAQASTAATFTTATTTFPFETSGSEINMFAEEDADLDDLGTAAGDDESLSGARSVTSAGSGSDASSSLPPTPFSPTSNYPCSEITRYSTKVNVDSTDYRPRYAEAVHVGPLAEFDTTRVCLEAAVGAAASGTVTCRNIGSTSLYYAWHRQGKSQTIVAAVHRAANQLAEAGSGAEPSTVEDHYAKTNDADPVATSVEEESFSRFYFNDLEGVILPGDSKTFTFMFKSPTHGIYSVSWEFETTPKLAEGAVTVTVKGVALDEDLNEEARNAIEQQLHEQQTLHVVQDIVDDMIGTCMKPKPVPPPPQPSYRDLKSKFMAANRDITAFFSMHRLQSFTKFAERVTNTGVPTWDMSHGTLEQAIDKLENDVSKARFQEEYTRLIDDSSIPDYPATNHFLYSVGYATMVGLCEKIPAVGAAARAEVGLPPLPSFSFPTDAPLAATGEAYIGRTMQAFITLVTPKEEKPQNVEDEAATTNKRRRRGRGAASAAVNAASTNITPIPTPHGLVPAVPAQTPPDAARVAVGLPKSLTLLTTASSTAPPTPATEALLPQQQQRRRKRGRKTSDAQEPAKVEIDPAVLEMQRKKQLCHEAVLQRVRGLVNAAVDDFLALAKADDVLAEQTLFAPPFNEDEGIPPYTLVSTTMASIAATEEGDAAAGGGGGAGEDGGDRASMKHKRSIHLKRRQRREAAAAAAAAAAVAAGAGATEQLQH
eukprot:TRINITY_DN199_c0_g1_i7.p1 TRINITY_DN199_c0_g1~~TRINITY_DN199_c0_g1_i7.p1  ORF type:complete len:1183 (+),score=296.95 TRINITY_DN199_c0_g1_i7:31-3549(+)